MSSNQPASVVWEEPPYGKGSRGSTKHWQTVAETLRANPGKWARIATFEDAGRRAVNLAREINRGQIKALQGAEALSRTVDGEGRTYAQWPKPEAPLASDAGSGDPDGLDDLVDALLTRIAERLVQAAS